MPIKVVKELLCHHSKYFDKAFSFDSGLESLSNSIVLEDVTESTFQSFVNWLHLREITFDNGETDVTVSNIKEAVELFIFADKYDTKKLRNMCIGLIFGFLSVYYVVEDYHTQCTHTRISAPSIVWVFCSPHLNGYPSFRSLSTVG